MSLNENKTKIIHFRKKITRRGNFIFKCCDKVNQYTCNYKYLGLWFNEFNDMSFAAKEIAKSATRALGVIICKHKSLGGLPYTCFKKLYDTGVESILRYGAGVWGNKEHRILSSVQNKAARYLLGVQKTCSNIAVMGELGWGSWNIKQYTEVVRMWLRLSNMDPSRLTSKVFKHNCTKAIICRMKNWEKSIMDIFELHDLSFLNEIGKCDTNIVLRNCKEKLITQAASDWYNMLWDDSGLVNGNKLRTYRTFKTELVLSNYVSLNIPMYKKKVFSMLRCGSLPLEIEKGRQCRSVTPLNERLCRHCHSNVVEDEFHFVMQCNLYEDQRYELMQHLHSINDDFYNSNEQDKFISIMQCGNFKVINIVFQMFMGRLLHVYV